MVWWVGGGGGGGGDGGGDGGGERGGSTRLVYACSLDDIGVVIWSQQGNDHVTVPMSANGVLRMLTSGCVEPN